MKRIIACPASVPLAEAHGAVSSTSLWAAEGTVAHGLAENYLKAELVISTPLILPEGLVGRVVKMAGYDITVDEEMVSAVNVYLAQIDSLLVDQDCMLRTESVVRLDAVVGKDARCYGHLDTCIVDRNAGTLHIVDFKYGRGVEVAVDGNEQLLTYALGAIHSLVPADKLREIYWVVLHIVQPRTPGRPAVQSARYTLLDVQLWGDNVLKPAIDLVRNSKPEDLAFAVGDHCRFCPALAQCPAQATNALATARERFTPVIEAPPEPVALTNERLAEILDQAEVVTAWIDAVRVEAHARAERGEAIPGHKLVAKRGTRKWVRDDIVIGTTLHGMGLGIREIMTEPELRSVAQIEPKVPKDKRDEFKALWAMSSSGTTLAPAKDPRPAIAAGPHAAFKPLEDGT